MWLECIGVVSGCCCKKVYKFPHNITNPSLLHLLARFCSSILTFLFSFYMDFRSCIIMYVKML